MNDDAMLQYLIEMGAIQQQDSALQRKQAMVEALRSRQPADTGLQQAGRVTVAASPMAHLANAFNQAQAGFMQRQNDASADRLGQQRMDVLSRLRTRPAQARVDPMRSDAGADMGGVGQVPH